MHSSRFPLSIFFLFSMIKLCLSDCDNLQDTCPAATAPSDKKLTIFINGLPCKNPKTISAPDFKSSELINPGATDIFARSSVKIVTATDFPGLNTLGLSIARTDLELDGLVMPHSHPRATEMFFVKKGIVLAGFIDTKSNVFQNVLKEGDAIVFPRGLLHFCFNTGFDDAIVFSVLNSQNPGVVGISGAFFEPDHNFKITGELAKRLISFSKRDLLENQPNYYQNVTMLKFPSLFRS
ncbi:Germin [Parasponia andersonii]|uniref:Germin-like protein n=1 Tax=Parasponia andersonii TaxID=3476 RepID=A0A2P5B9C7_PARAD|nr:Germin [Parasponia andersonii]